GITREAAGGNSDGDHTRARAGHGPVGDPHGGDGRAEPGHRARARGLSEGDRGGAVGRDQVAARIPDLGRDGAIAARGRARGGGGERQTGVGPGDDRERGGAAGEAGGGGGDRDRARPGSGHGLGGDPGGGGGRAEPGDRARAGGLSERHHGGVVARH